MTKHGVMEEEGVLVNTLQNVLHVEIFLISVFISLYIGLSFFKNKDFHLHENVMIRVYTIHLFNKTTKLNLLYKQILRRHIPGTPKCFFPVN